jgi:peptidoglycan/xylan/chitin deacetylase (PgdA/CDA1 family)
MSFRSQLGDIRRSLLCTLYRRTVALGNSGPIVSFTFDDFPHTACSVGAPILEAYGARGTYYVTAGLMNSSNQLGPLFHRNDLSLLVEHGHELGTHTYSHRSCREVSTKAFREDIERGKRAVEDFAGHDSINFAYPYGAVTLRIKKQVGTKLNSCRGIVPGYNGPDVDLNLLRANKLYGGLEQAREIEALIRENARRKSWLIFYTHDVRRHPSAYGCTPDLLELTASIAARSGSRLLTVGATLAELGLPCRAASVQTRAMAVRV